MASRITARLRSGRTAKRQRGIYGRVAALTTLGPLPSLQERLGLDVKMVRARGHETLTRPTSEPCRVHPGQKNGPGGDQWRFYGS